MKINSIGVSLSLGIFGSLLAVALSKPFEINLQRVFAQEVASSCPLPEDQAAAFLDSKCKEVKLREPQTFFHYYSNDTNKRQRYLTTEEYQTNVEAIKNLALKQEWGNKAEKVISVILPAGTTIYEGIAAPQDPISCYPGGGQLTVIKDTRDPNIKWVEGSSLIVESFSCP